MNTFKKIVSETQERPCPPLSQHPINTLKAYITELFRDSERPYAHIPFRNAYGFIMNASLLYSKLIAQHRLLYDWLSHESTRLFKTYQKSTHEVRDPQKIAEAEQQYEADYKKIITPLEESLTYDALSTFYFTVLSLQTLSLCNYWSQKPDSTDYAAKKEEFNERCGVLLSQIYLPLSKQHDHLHKSFLSRPPHASELPPPDSVPFDVKSELGMATWPSLYHPLENQDAMFVSRGTTILLDGVSSPPSHEAPREVGQHILDEINRTLPLFLETSDGNPFTTDWQLQIIALIYQSIRTSVYSLSDHSQATTLALHVTIKISPSVSHEPQYLIFSFHIGDSETMIVDSTSKKISPLNPLFLQEHLTGDIFNIELPPTSDTAQKNYAAVLSVEIVDAYLRQPRRRNTADPGFTIQHDSSTPCVCTVAHIPASQEKTKRILTASDGLTDNFEHFERPIDVYPAIAEVMDQLMRSDASDSQVAHALVALAKLHYARRFANPSLFGKEDDISAVVSTPAAGHWDYVYPKPAAAPAAHLTVPESSSPPKSPDGKPPKRSPGHRRSTATIEG